MDGDQAQAQAILSDMTEVNCTYVLRVTKATASIDGSFNSLSCNCDSQTRLLEGLMPNQPLFKFRKTQLLRSVCIHLTTLGRRHSERNNSFRDTLRPPGRVTE